MSRCPSHSSGLWHLRSSPWVIGGKRRLPSRDGRKGISATLYKGLCAAAQVLCFLAPPSMPLASWPTRISLCTIRRPSFSSSAPVKVGAWASLSCLRWWPATHQLWGESLSCLLVQRVGCQRRQGRTDRVPDWTGVLPEKEDLSGTQWNVSGPARRWGGVTRSTCGAMWRALYEVPCISLCPSLLPSHNNVATFFHVFVE